MSILSYLFVFLFVTQLAWGYTVVLNSGKRVEGTLISDRESTIVIRDSKGVVISFKKAALNHDAMNVANSQLEEEKPVEAAQRSGNLRGLADLARETKKLRTGKSRAVTLEDLTNTPQITVLGSEEVPAQRDSGGKPSDTKTEREWENRLWKMRQDVNRLRERRIEASTSCEESRRKQQNTRITPSTKPVELLSTYKESSACRKLAEIESQLEQAETRLEDERELARRSGVSWQTLE